MEVAMLVALALSTSACGGGGGAGGNSLPPSSSPPPPANASPGGIWKGKTSQGQSLVGIVTESGEFHFLQEDGVQYFCGILVSGSSISAGFTGITQVGTQFANGATYGSGSLSGTVAERSTLTGSISFTAASGQSPAAQKPGSEASAPRPCGASAAAAPAGKSGLGSGGGAAKLFNEPPTDSQQAPAIAGGTFTLAYDSLYDRDSALATISGNFGESNGTVVTINTAGRIFSQDATSGCVINGTVRVIDSRYNAYGFDYEFSNCNGELSKLNGAAFAGLGTLDNTVTPEQVIVAVTYQSDAKAFGLIQVLPRI